MSKEKRSLKTPMFRGSFVNLHKPRKRDEASDKEQYSIMIVLPKAKPSTKDFIAKLQKMITEASAEKHGAPGLPKNKLKHYPIKDGDDMDHEQFHGHWCINAASNFKVHCVDEHLEDLTTGEELYSGAWYKVKISAWAWTNPKSGKGVSINLESVIKLKDDTRIGGGSNAKDDFADDAVEDEGGSEEEDDLLG